MSVAASRVGTITEQLVEVDRAPGKRRAELHARLAVDGRTKRDAFRLRHLCYHSRGHIDSIASGEFSDAYDFDSANTTLVVYEADRAVASVRICVADRTLGGADAHDLPLAQVFPDEYHALMRPDGRAMEINRLVRHPDYPSQAVVFVLFQMVGLVVRESDPDFVASCVRPNHVKVYERMCFEHVAGPKLYTGLKFMTHFLACHRVNYPNSFRFKPLRSGEETRGPYARLLAGSSIPVADVI